MIVLKTLLDRSQQAAKQSVPQLLLFVLCLAFALACELVIFNAHALFFSEQTWPAHNITQAVNEKYQRPGYMFTSKAPGIIYSNLNLPAENIYVKMWSPHTYPVRVKISFSDTSYLTRVPACDFMVNPGGEENSYTCRVLTAGNLTSLQVDVDPSTMKGDILLSELIINNPPSLYFSKARVFFLALAIFLIICGIRGKWHLLTTDSFSAPRRRLLLSLVPALALLFTCHVFGVLSPQNSAPLSVFQPGGYILNTISPSDHKLLHPLPKTEDLRYYDRYTVLLHALVNYRFSLDLPVDPKLSAMENPYSPDQRHQLGVKYFYDYAFYKGSYYSYFGLAPILTVYLPVYILTGKVPADALTGLILTILSVISLSLAFNVLFSVLIKRCNLLLFMGVQTALLCSCGLWFFQTVVWEYNFPIQTGMIYTALLTAATWALLAPCGTLMQRLCLVGAGLCVPLIVMSRPLMLAPALCLSVPPLIAYLRSLPRRRAGTAPAAGARLSDGTWSADRLLEEGSRALTLIPALLLTGAPVLIGALFVMYYNAARFGSIFDFGAFYNLTGYDMPNHSFAPLLPVLSAEFWHYFLEQPDFIKNFPFITAPAQNYADFGKSIFLEKRVSFLAWPLLWALLLIFWRGSFSSYQNSDESNSLSTFKSAAWLTCLIMPVIVHLEACTAGYCYRYMSELTLPLAIIASVLLLRLLKDTVPSGVVGILYLALSVLLLRTVAMALLIPFSIDVGNHLAYMNADHFVMVSRILSPFSF